MGGGIAGATRGSAPTATSHGEAGGVLHELPPRARLIDEAGGEGQEGAGVPGVVPDGEVVERDPDSLIVGSMYLPVLVLTQSD